MKISNAFFVPLVHVQEVGEERAVEPLQVQNLE